MSLYLGSVHQLPAKPTPAAAPAVLRRLNILAALDARRVARMFTAAGQRSSADVALRVMRTNLAEARMHKARA